MGLADYLKTSRHAVIQLMPPKRCGFSPIPRLNMVQGLEMHME